METDLELLRASVSAMIFHCEQYDKGYVLLSSLKKHRNTIDLMINHEEPNKKQITLSIPSHEADNTKHN